MKQIEIRPLTYTTGKGYRYTRPPEVEARIRWALSLGQQKLKDQVEQRDFNSEEFVPVECLVYLIRMFRREKNWEMVEVLVAALIERIKVPVDMRVRFPLNPTYVTDCYNDAIGEVIGQIIDENSDKCDFAEVRFWVWLDRRILNVLRKYILRQRKDVITESHDQTDSDEQDFAETPEVLRDKAISADLKSFIWEALEILDKRERLIFVMRHYWDWETKNENPKIMTISRYFNVSDRMVRKWFIRVYEKLEKWQKGRQV